MTERTLESRTVYDGRLLRVEALDVELASGRHAVRDVVRHPGAVAVLAQLPDDRFVFVRQFRTAIGRPLLEIVAGTREPDEARRDCAVRELGEETGCVPDRLDELGVMLPAPGYTDEAIHLYHARVRPVAEGPSPDDDEDIEVVLLTGEEVEQRITSGDITDGKTLSAWLLYTRRM